MSSKQVFKFLMVCGACVLLVNYWTKKLQRTCSIDAINSNDVEQDDTCLLSLIRSSFLHPPPSSCRLHLDSPEVVNPSMGQSQVVMKILNNKENGFFIECGALDGELRSNTLFMEQNLGWDGVLIEADPENFKKVIQKNRRAWTVPACLSTTSTPKKLFFDQRFNEGRISSKQDNDHARERSVLVQCFPIYSIMAALNRTTVDYFSLDVEGDEIAVLKTIPWHRVNIKVLSVEFLHGKGGKDELKLFMETLGYRIFEGETDPSDWAFNDLIFYK